MLTLSLNKWTITLGSQNWHSQCIKEPTPIYAVIFDTLGLKHIGLLFHYQAKQAKAYISVCHPKRNPYADGHVALYKRQTWDSLNYGHQPSCFQVSGLWHTYRAMSARGKKESEEIMTMKALNCCGCCLAKCFRSENIWNRLKQGIGKWSSIWMNQLLHPSALIGAMAYFRDLSFVM